MSIRITLLWLVVLGLVIYSWRDWFISLCGLILLVAVIEHEDFPKSIMGISGFNLWNVLLVAIVFSWLAHRRSEGLFWDMPRYLNLLLLLYLGIILVGFVRMLIARSPYMDYIPLGSLFSEELLNTIKWVIPGLLVFDGCRSQSRLKLVVFCLLAMYFLLAVQVCLRLPPSAIYDDGDLERLRMIIKDIGYSACDMSAVLAGVFWAFIASISLFSRRRVQFIWIGMALIILYAQALTGGRAGFLAWGGCGLALCLMRWHKYLLLAPIIPFLLYVIFPGAAGRMLKGFSETDTSGEKTINQKLVTSDRTLFWPYVIDYISASPFVGYGRLGMVSTGLMQQTKEEVGEGYPHPHNAILEWLLDNGIIGFIPIVFFYGAVIFLSARLFRHPTNPWLISVGGASLSLVIAQLISGIGSQHFYPTESTLGMWIAVFLSLRISIAQSRKNFRPSSPVMHYQPFTRPNTPSGSGMAG